MSRSSVANPDRRLSRRSTGRVAATALVLLAVLTAALLTLPPAHAATSPDPAPQPRIIFYGDSQLHESRDRIQTLVDARFHSSWDVVVKSFPGSAICGWLADMRQEHATIVALLFSGVWIGSTCENPLYSHRAWPASYYSDLTAAVQMWQARGTKVVLLHWPEACCQPAPSPDIWDHYEAIAARYGVTTLDPAQVLFNPFENTWPAQLPCLSATEPGCDLTTHEIAVRDAPSTTNLRGGHLCPVQGIAIPCPVYSSGVERYAEAVARDVGDVMEQTVSIASTPHTRWR
jgi:hypothetical protein